MQSEPITKRLVLVGAGHAHIIVLHRFAMRPVQGLEIVLISDTAFAPYSGMIPGYLLGLYKYEDLHFDLEKLCAQAQVRFIKGRVEQISLKQKWIQYDHDKKLIFDFISTDIGIEPGFSGINTPESGLNLKSVTTLKPISKLIPKINEIFGRTDEKLDIAIIGAGPSGFEVAHALKIRLPNAQLHLFGSKALPLEGHSRSVQSAALKSLKQRSILFYANSRVTHIDEGSLKYSVVTESSSTTGDFRFDHCFLATNAKSFDWLKTTDLPLDESGFIRIRSNLQMQDYEFAFAAGDCAAFPISQSRSLPKAGVYAVRQGPVLADNLRHVISASITSVSSLTSVTLGANKGLRNYHPQKTALALLVCGPSHALLSKGRLLSFIFKLAWFQKILFAWKDSIDRTFMIRFQNITMQQMQPLQSSAAIAESNPDSNAHPNELLLSQSIKTHCLGCGSKIPRNEVSKIIHELKHRPITQDGFLSEMWTDDATPLDVGNGFQSFVTVDGMAIFSSDPELGARALFSHAANDLLSMGLKPRAFTLDVMLSNRAPHLRSERLLEIMRGIERGAAPFDAKLLNAHSRESNSNQDHITFTMISESFKTDQQAIDAGDVSSKSSNRILHKGPMTPGLKLILTKPLGTGIALRSLMLGALSGTEIQKLRTYFDQDHSGYLSILKSPFIKFATDISGFGLRTHLSEMLIGTSTKIELDHIPYLDFIDRVIREVPNVLPRLLIENQAADRSQETFNISFKNQHPVHYDPTTNGPILLAVDENHFEKVTYQLQTASLPYFEIGRSL